MKTRLMMLAILCFMFFTVLITKPQRAAAQPICLNGTCCGEQYGYNPACEEDCVQAIIYCRNNPTGTYNGPSVSNDCSNPYYSANQCGNENCYGCVEVCCPQ